MIAFLRTSKSEESGYDSDTRRSLEALSGRKGEEGKETEEEEEVRGSDSSGLGVEPHYQVGREINGMGLRGESRSRCQWVSFRCQDGRRDLVNPRDGGERRRGEGGRWGGATASLAPQTGSPSVLDVGRNRADTGAGWGSRAGRGAGWGSSSW